jgi:hypothetical protein
MLCIFLRSIHGHEHLSLFYKKTSHLQDVWNMTCTDSITAMTEHNTGTLKGYKLLKWSVISDDLMTALSVLTSVLIRVASCCSVSMDRPVTSVTVNSEIYISVLSTPVKLVTFPFIFILHIPITVTANNNRCTGCRSKSQMKYKLFLHE